MFSRTERCMSRPSARSPGTSAMPARMASAGWAKCGGRPSTSMLPPAGRMAPERAAKSSSWPWPSRATMPMTSPSRSSKETSSSLLPTLRFFAARRGGPSLRTAAAVRVAARARSMRAPSISSTMRSSTPGAMGRMPTVSPSRSTVARSQRAEISRKRWEMKMTARPVWPWRRTTSRTRSARLAGRAAVISSRMRTSGSSGERAGEVEDALDGEREVAGRLRGGRGRGRRARAPSRGRARRGCR